MKRLIERVPPLRWTAWLLGRVGLDGAGLVVAVPVLWLTVFFLIPFLVVAKISLSEAAIAMPPYLPLLEWDEGRAIVTLNFGNFQYLFDDPLYLNAYLSSLWIAFVSAMAEVGDRSSIALRWSGRDPPPSRKEPAETTPSMTFLGATVQVTRQPG